MSQGAFATAAAVTSCAFAPATGLVTRVRAARAAPAAAATRRVRMAAGPPSDDGEDGPPGDSLRGPPVAVLADGDFELADGEEAGAAEEPRPFVNAAAIADARGRFRRHETDTGSPEFQIATLTTKITYLTAHLKKNPKDYATTRGLVKMVAKRRRLLKFLKGESTDRFTAIIDGMDIRVSQELRRM